MKSTADLNAGQAGHDDRPDGQWTWLFSELRTLARDWLYPAAVGLGAALLVGLALAIVLGHEDPGSMSWHNLTALLVGLTVGAYAFARRCRGVSQEGGGDDRIRTGE